MRIARTVWVAAIAVAIVAAVYTVSSAHVSTGAQCTADKDCSAGGCSGQICTTAKSAPGAVTTCEWREEYGCLQLTSCGCTNGICAWQNTTEYQNCLANVA